MLGGWAAGWDGGKFRKAERLAERAGAWRSKLHKSGRMNRSFHCATAVPPSHAPPHASMRDCMATLHKAAAASLLIAMR